MLVSVRKTLIIGLTLAALLLLQGCVSMRLAYNHAPDYVYWKLDGFVDFNAEQKPRVKQAITDWMNWHRRTQLPDYARLIAAHRAEVRGEMAPAAVCALMDRARERIDKGWVQVIPAVADIALTLQPKQIEHIEKRYASVNDDYHRDHLQPTPAERQKAMAKRATDSAEKLYGRLHAAQLAVIEKGVAASPLNADLWSAELEDRQREGIATIRRLIAENATHDQAVAAFKSLVTRFRRSPLPEHAENERRVEAYNCGFWAAIHNSTTPAQRTHAAERLERWATDFQLLSDE
jgi:hypothetical protein